MTRYCLYSGANRTRAGSRGRQQRRVSALRTLFWTKTTNITSTKKIITLHKSMVHGNGSAVPIPTFPDFLAVLGNSTKRVSQWTSQH